MARYCFYCGRELAPGEKCSCREGQSSRSAAAGNRTDTATGAATGSGPAYTGFSQTKKSSETFKSARSTWTRWRNRLRRFDPIRSLHSMLLHTKDLLMRPDRSAHLNVEVSIFTPALIMIFQAILVFFWVIELIRRTGLGHFFRYYVFTVTPTSEEIYRFASVGACTILSYQIIKIFILYIALRVTKYHRTSFSRCYRLTYSSNAYLALINLASFLFLFGSGFFAAGLFFFGIAFTLVSDCVLFQENLGMSRRKALFFAVVVHLCLLLIMATACDLIFTSISGFHMEKGLAF